VIFVFSLKNLLSCRFYFWLFDIILLIHRQKNRWTQTFFLRSCCIIFLVVLLSRKYWCWLHSTTFFWAKKTFNLQPTLHAKATTIIADPICFGRIIYSITLLMNWDIAGSTKNNQIFIFIITIIANCTLSIFLHCKSSFVWWQLTIPDVFFQSSVILFRLLKLLQYHGVVYVIFLLLPHL